MSAPVVGFKLEASGPAPHGYTVTKLPPMVGFTPSTTVKFNATAPIPEPGSPPLFNTFNISGKPLPSAAPTFEEPRVSNTRDGDNGTNDSGPAADDDDSPFTLKTTAATTNDATTTAVTNEPERIFHNIVTPPQASPDAQGETSRSSDCMP